MGKLYKKYKDYQLFNEIMGDEEPDPDSGNNGCLTVIFVVFAAVMVLLLF